MLQSIRDNAKGWVAYLIVGIIVFPLALFGIGEYFQGGSSVNAAVVNGEEVPSRQVQDQLRQLRRQFGNMAASLGDDQLKQMALDNVVNQKLLRQKAEDEGYRANSQEVAQAISQYFQKDGQFDAEQYQLFLRNQRRDQGDFEQQIRDDLTLGQFQEAISISAFVPKAEAEYYQSLRKQKRDVEFFALKVTDFEEQVQLTDEKIAEYYEQNNHRFMTEEKVKLAYIEIDQDKLAETIEVDDDALQAFYDENADRYLIPEERNTSHVLIEIVGDKEDEAKAKAQGLYEAITSGQRTFEDVASNDSDDKVAAENEGVLGDVVVDDWDPDFEKVVFALEVNQVSEPVKTGAGFEIIRVNSITEAKQRTYEEAKEELEDDLRKTKASDIYLDKTDRVQTIVYEQSGDLAPAADATGLEVQSSDWVTRREGVGVTANPKVREAAFSDEVLKERKNSEPVELKDGHAVVVRVTEQEAAQQKPLDEVREEIVNTLTAQEARTLVAQKGEELLGKLQASGDWTGLTESGLGQADSVEKSGLVERTGSKLAPTVVSKVFGMSRPEDGKASWDSAVLPSGDYVLISLKSVEDGASELDEASGQLFGGSVGGRELGAMLKALRERAEIELMPENI